MAAPETETALPAAPPASGDATPRDAAWEDYLAAELAAETETVRRFLTIPQALELARLHVIEGRSPEEIAARWPDWTAEGIRRALRTRRFELAAQRLQAESATTAGRLIARLNIAATDTIDRIIRIGQGREFVGTTVDKDGNAVPTPFGEKTQWEALRWHADRVLPPVSPSSTSPGAGGVTIYNQTTYIATMQHLSAGMTKLSALFGGDQGSSPREVGPGGVDGLAGVAVAGSPPSMSSFLKRGAAELIPPDTTAGLTAEPGES